MTPIGLPSTRMNAVITPIPNFGRISSTEPTSASRWTISCMSYSRSRFSGITWRSGRWSWASHSGTVPWKYDRYLFVTSTASSSSLTRMSTTPFGTWNDIGPTSSGV